MTAATMDDFSAAEILTGETTIFVRSFGTGAPVLLLHGFPQTHVMWRSVAPLLARDFTVVCADLRGYGRSGCPPSAPDHAPYAKRAMAQDMDLMALDHPRSVDRLAVLDIVPTETAWDRADARFVLAFWPWSLLAQPEPLPERIVTAVPDAIVDDALGGWGSASAVFPPEVRAAYVEALRDPAHAHAICEEYRAAATIDREHDRAARAEGRRISCPVLVAWSGRGPLATWYIGDSGPIALWRAWSDTVQGHSLDAGHFFPEEAPEETADMLNRFFGA
jgi:haloacetate dehalogenase